jgi:hypothetical protein
MDRLLTHGCTRLRLWVAQRGLFCIPVLPYSLMHMSYVMLSCMMYQLSFSFAIHLIPGLVLLKF